jgi:signal transduction histidine kinase
MLSRSTSPLRDQRGNEPSILPKVVSRAAIGRKLPGTSPIRGESQSSLEQRDGLNSPSRVNNYVLWNAADLKLLGTAAHDLRNPVAAILIYSELLAEALGHTVSKEQGAMIESIHSVSQYMLHLLDDTLDFASSQPGTAPLRATPAILVDILAQSVAMLSPLAARKNMHLNLIQEGKPVPVLVNGTKISKVFNNLIENAVKYCQPGARIEVRISRTPEKVLVSVQDDGPGICPSDLNTLFTPFHRTRARALSEEQGTGLGLAIAKHVVDLHGGRIEVESQVGKGTTFHVSLPAQSRHTPKKS